MSSLQLDVDQAGELKAWFRKGRGIDGSEWTNYNLKTLCEDGQLSGRLLDILKGKAKVVPLWEVDEKVIYFSATTEGWDAETWLRLFASRREKEDGDVSLLNSADFVPSNGVTRRLAVIPTSMFVPGTCTIEVVMALAKKLNLGRTTIEDSCLFSHTIGLDNMVLLGMQWVIGMHDPAKGLALPIRFLNHRNYGSYDMTVKVNDPQYIWPSNGGFLFAKEPVARMS